MSVLASLLGRRPSRERPDLAAWICGAAPVLVVDGDGSGGAYAGAVVLRHETTGGPGLPFHYPDERRLPAADGEFRAIVLADVLGKLIDAGAALDECKRALAKGGLLLVVQTVAPEDYEERAIWNAAAKLHDVRHASAPSPRQFAALMSGTGLAIERDTSWEEPGPALATSGGRLAMLLNAAAARRAERVVKDGVFVMARRAYLLRRP